MLQIVQGNVYDSEVGTFHRTELIATSGEVIRRVDKRSYLSMRDAVTIGYLLREAADRLPSAFSRELTVSTLCQVELELFVSGYNQKHGTRYEHDVRTKDPAEFAKWVIKDASLVASKNYPAVSQDPMGAEITFNK